MIARRFRSLMALLFALIVLVSCSRRQPPLAPEVVVIPGKAVLNEVWSRGVPTDLDWIELYNPTPTALDISGYKIYDSGGQSGVKEKKGFPVGTVIPGGGYYVIVTDGTAASDFGLSSAGEQVWLEDDKGQVVDTVTFLAMDVTQSYGRLPDGGTTWQLLSTITRGSANKP